MYDVLTRGDFPALFADGGDANKFKFVGLAAPSSMFLVILRRFDLMPRSTVVIGVPLRSTEFVMAAEKSPRLLLGGVKIAFYQC